MGSHADTPRHKCAGVPLSSSGLAALSLLRGGSVLLAGGYSHTLWCACFRVPHGTALLFEPLKCFVQDIPCSVFVPIHHQPTMHTAMGALAQTLLDHVPTS